MLSIIPALCALPAQGAQKIKTIKVVVSNPGDRPRNAADIVIPIAQLRGDAPDFTPGALIVTVSDASTLEQDASTLQTEELPSQVDDLDSDGKGDELAFQIDLAPHQTRIVTVSYGDQDRIWRLRGDYQQRTAALFSRKIEGLGWESERVAFRVYLDPRNAIDLYGKRRPTLQLAMYAAPDYIYHDESPEGRDIYKVGDAIGIGSVAALVDGKVIKVAEVKERKWRIVASGPVRTIVELEYDGWNAGGKIIDLRSRITQWAGERGFTHTIFANSADDLELLLGRLASSRLISTGREGDEIFVEVSHEALIREWSALREWLTENREELRLQRRLQQSADEWNSLNRDAGALLRGARLAQGEEWLAKTPAVPSLLRDFLAASAAARSVFPIIFAIIFSCPFADSLPLMFQK